MDLKVNRPIFIWLLVVVSACASAKNTDDRLCKSIEPGIYSSTSSSGIDVTFTITENAIVVENKFLRSIISKEQGYRVETINQESSSFKNLNELFSGLYPNQVGLIDKKRCGQFFSKEGHEFYLLPSINKDIYLLFEYSDIDPPEVYQLTK